MAASIIDGNAIAKQIRDEIKAKLDACASKPGLAVVQVGENPASTRYVSHKQKDCKEVGIYSEKHHLPETVSEKELIDLIQKLNAQANIHGILVQLPLPDGMDEHKVINSVDPKKDVDGFHTENLGELVSGNEHLVPCTPTGVIHLIESTGIEIKGKKAVVVGRSVIVGKPAALLLLNRHATVTVCHSRTPDLGAETRQADILVAAVGKPRLITGAMVKPGAVVIDVGINVIDGKMIGDVDFESVEKVAGHLSPVPGGVGPMTRAFLLKNTLKAAGI
jgi:methylenetetrahydrofolate dehydrogenase (NADP+)/methenyltetrahydrofolate cyclohydrolase